MFDLRDPSDYQIVHKDTGEVDELDLYLTKGGAKGWNQTYPQEFARLLSFIGGQQAQLLSWMILNRNGDNLVLESVASISEKAGISKSTSARTLKALQSRDFLRKVKNGMYMVDPRLVSWGGSAFQRLSRKWGDLA